MTTGLAQSPTSPVQVSVEQPARRRFRWELLVIPLAVAHVAFFVVPQLVFVVNAFFPAEGPTLIGDRLTLENFRAIVLDRYYLIAFFRTAWVSAATALVCLVAGYPVAYLLSRSQRAWTTPVLLIVMSSVFVSLVVRTLGWKTVLADSGFVASMLASLPFVGEHIKLLNTPTGIIIGLVHTELPFMILTLVPILQAISPSLEEAAAGLGASHVQAFRRVVFPLSLPGVVAGLLLVFSVSMGLYVPPALLGGNLVAMAPILIYSEAMVSLNYPMAAALSTVLAVVVMATISIAGVIAARTVRMAALQIRG